ncbi:hypothetical protein LINPERPRIM_LOCUS27403 [Linum perenne]
MLWTTEPLMWNTRVLRKFVSCAGFMDIERELDINRR